MTQLLDLTHPLGPDASAPPALPRPRVERVRTIASHGRNSSVLECAAHTGTHLDAPCHTTDEGVDISAIPLERLIGPAVCWSFPMEEGRGIEVADLEAAVPPLDRGDAVLLHTGWARHYGTPTYRQHPWLTVEAARWLVERGVRLIGVDTPNPDRPIHKDQPSFDFRVHHETLDRDVLIVENIGDMEPIANRRVKLYVMSIPWVGSDGSPARVFVEY